MGGSTQRVVPFSTDPSIDAPQWPTPGARPLNQTRLAMILKKTNSNIGPYLGGGSRPSGNYTVGLEAEISAEEEIYSFDLWKYFPIEPIETCDLQYLKGLVEECIEYARRYDGSDDDEETGYVCRLRQLARGVLNKLMELNAL